MFKAIKRFWAARLGDTSVWRRYVRAGAVFGEAVSYIYMGECVGFAKLLGQWEFWEQEVARRGFRTVSLDAFVQLGGYGVPLKAPLAKRRPDEKPVCHARIYRERYLGKLRPAIDFDRMMRDGQPQCGTYIRPTTEDVREDN